MKKSKKNAAAVKAVGKKRTVWQNIIRYRVLILMCLPAILFFLAFNYIPLPGIYVAFVNYNYRGGIFGSPFVGLDNFKFLGNLVAVFLAILLNEMRSKWFKKVSQTMMFLPYFISQVLVGLLVYNMLNYDYGFVNSVLSSLGMEKWGPYSNPKVWPFLIVLVNLWQNTGYNSVVYFAAIMGIDAEIIEAARVDGANAFQKIRYIIIPGLRPTIVILLLFALGGIVRGNFGLFYNIIGQNSILYPTTDIIETYVYRATITDFNFSTASAVGFYQSIIGFALVMLCNFVVKKIEPDYSLF